MDFFNASHNNNIDTRGILRKKTTVAPPKIFTSKPKVRVRNIEEKDHDNVRHIHEQVLTFFEEETRKVEELEIQKSNLRWISKNGLSKYEKNQAIKRIENLDQQIEEIRSERKKKEYLTSVEPLMKKYRELINKPIIINFMTKEVQDTGEKEKVTKDILDIAEKYIKVNRTKVIVQQIPKCSECGNEELQRMDGHVVCVQCGLEETFLNISEGSYKDIDRVNTSSRYEYDRRSHFRDAINNLQGKQNVRIKEEVYQTLQLCIEQNKIPYERITPDNLILFMKENNLSKYYEHVYLIHKKLTGRDCSPDISSYEKELFERHEMILTVYQEVKPPDKKNFINAHYVLLQLLRIMGWEPRRTDFEILKTREKLIEHDDIWFKICQRLNSPQSSWIYYPTV